MFTTYLAATHCPLPVKYLVRIPNGMALIFSRRLSCAKPKQFGHSLCFHLHKFGLSLFVDIADAQPAMPISSIHGPIQYRDRRPSLTGDWPAIQRRIDR